jgi:ribonuclease Z
MGLRENILDEVRGHSLAMHSTWFYHNPTRALFDAGEGLSARMRNRIFWVENVFLSHGHYDHIGGLIGLIYSRTTCRRSDCRGASPKRGKVLTVYFPAGWNEIYNLMQYVDESLHGTEKVKWVPVNPGDLIPVGTNTSVQVFEVLHSKGGLCLGYKVVETRTRLKDSFVGKSGNEIRDIANVQGRDARHCWRTAGTAGRLTRTRCAVPRSCFTRLPLWTRGTAGANRTVRSERHWRPLRLPR